MNKKASNCAAGALLASSLAWTSGAYASAMTRHTVGTDLRACDVWPLRHRGNQREALLPSDRSPLIRSARQDATSLQDRRECIEFQFYRYIERHGRRSYWWDAVKVERVSSA